MKSIYQKSNILWTRKYKAGYVLQREEVIGYGAPGKPLQLTVAYTRYGNYIGNARDAYRLCVKRGIAPELANIKDKTCSIGWCKKEQKWYGWSHRAIYGFKIGDVVKEGDCCVGNSPNSLPIGFKAKDLSDARRMAIAFAESVS